MDKIDADRTIRVEILEGGEIEILRVSESGKTRNRVNYDNLDAAMVVIEMLIRSAHEHALKNRFVPKVIQEGKKEFERLEKEAAIGKI